MSADAATISSEAGAPALPAARRTGRRVVYMCTFTDYDQIFSPVMRAPGVDYVLISERPPRFVRGWSWRPFPPETRGLDQTMANRWCKFFPERLFPDAECSIYVDGMTLVRGDVRPLFDEFTASGAAIGLFRHSRRDDIRTELAECKRVGRLKPSDFGRADAQVERYFREGLPEDHIFSENGILVRRHGAPGLEEAMSLWWRELTTETRRDQLSLPYVLHVFGLPVKLWPWSYKEPNPYFARFGHKGDLLRDVYNFLRMKALYSPIHARAFGPAAEIMRAILRLRWRLSRRGGGAAPAQREGRMGGQDRIGLVGDPDSSGGVHPHRAAAAKRPGDGDRAAAEAEGPDPQRPRIFDDAKPHGGPRPEERGGRR